MQEHPIMMTIFLVGCFVIGYYFVRIGFTIKYYVDKWFVERKNDYNKGYNEGLEDMAHWIRDNAILTDEQESALVEGLTEKVKL